MPNKTADSPCIPNLFYSVLPLVERWLIPIDQKRLACCSRALSRHRKYLPCPIHPLTNPFRRRKHGFGRSKIGLYAAHDQPGFELIAHLTWPFLENDDRVHLAQSDPIFAKYASLRLFAFRHRDQLYQLRQPRPPLPETPALCPKRSQLAGAALLSFDFIVGDLLRWMGGEYTNSVRDLSRYEAEVERYRHIPSIPGHPPLDCNRLLAIQRDGVPLQGRFECKRKDMLARLKYDNHPPLRHVLPEVQAAFAKEEASSYHLHLPRFLARFIFGLFLCPISWVVQKGKGRIIIDGSSPIHDDDDTGAPNSYIPKCGTPGAEDECPPAYFGNAMKRHLNRIWNLRIDYPTEDLLQHSDDINAAFRRGTYHCDIGIAFAYVFLEFLLIPIGMIFGARNSPSWWDILAEWRSHLGTTKDYTGIPLPMADNVQLVPDMTAAERAAIPPAIADSQNQGIPEALRARGQIAMYVDDNCTVNIRARIKADIRASVGSAFDCFGYPNEDRRLPCLRDEKFSQVASFCVDHLGFQICTRTMRVILPEQKVHTLISLLESGWLPQPPLTTVSPKAPKDIAILLGHIRNGCSIFPLGAFTSIRLTQLLTTAMSLAGARQTTNKNWWRRRCIKITAEVLPDLRLLYETLRRTTGGQTAVPWSRLIACLVRRDPTGQALSDAAYTGMGGWSPTFRFLWRLTRSDLEKCGFSMKLVDAYASEPTHHDDAGLHINLLEFVALIINLWLCVHYIRRDPSKQGGHVLLLRADNTSALSWLRHAARCHSRPVRNLAYFAHAIFIFSGIYDYTQLCHNHIAGEANVEADACSRPEKFPSLDSAISQFSPLQTCQPFLLPFGLLSTIATIISSPKIEGTFEQQMTQLMTLAPHTSPTGYTASMGSMPGFYKRSHRTRRSR